MKKQIFWATIAAAAVVATAVAVNGNASNAGSTGSSESVCPDPRYRELNPTACPEMVADDKAKLKRLGARAGETA